MLEMYASSEEVSRIADALDEFVEQTATAIDQMIASIHQVATNTESFSSFATETASSMVEMNASSEQIGNSARQSSELAASVKDAASEGRQAVSGTVEGMRRIESAMVEAAGALTELGEEVLEKILELTARSTMSIAEIARATQEQARGSGAATKAIEEVTKMIQQTAAATQQQSQTSTKIGEQAATVRDTTHHLKRAVADQQSGSTPIAGAMENS